MILAFFTLQLIVHAFNLGVVALKLTNDHLLVDALLETVFDLLKMLHDLWQLISVGLLSFSFLQKECRLFSKLINL